MTARILLASTTIASVLLRLPFSESAGGRLVCAPGYRSRYRQTLRIIAAISMPTKS